MPELLKNKRTGEYGYRTETGEVIPVDVARNKKTGAIGWRPKGSSDQFTPYDDPDDFATRAASMDPMDISIARAKNDAFGEYLRQQATQPRAGESEQERFVRLYGGKPQERPGQMETAARGFSQGATLGFGDELASAVAAAANQQAGGTFGERFGAYQSRHEAALGQGREDYPVTAYGSEIAGAIPTSMLPVLNVARGGNVARAVGTGALQGGIYGAGTAEGGMPDRAVGGAIGAGLGGALGGASVPIASGVGNLAKSLAIGRAAKDVGVSKPAYNIMGRVMSADDALTGQGARNIAAAGPEGMIADAGASASGLLDTAVQKGGPGARIARQNVDQRVNAATKEVAETLDDILGAPKGIKTEAKNIARRTASGRSAAYEEAYASAIDYASPAGMKIEEVVSRVPRRVMERAIAEANDAMVSVGERNQQIMVNIAEDGSVVFQEMPNVLQLDALKKALGGMGRESVDQFGRPTQAGVMYSRLANELRDAIVDAAPSYKEAIGRGFDKIEMDNALKLGRSMLRAGVTREDVSIALRGMSDAAKREARIGLRGYVDDMLAQVKSAMTDPNVDARETLKAVKEFSSRASKEKVGALLGKDEATRLYDVLERAEKTFGVRAKIAENSKTFARQEAAKMVGEEAKGGVISSLRHAEPVEAAKGLARTMMGRSEAQKQAISDSIYQEFAQILTGPRGEDAASKLALLAQSVPATQAAGTRASGLAQRLMTPIPAISGGMAGQLMNSKRR